MDRTCLHRPFGLRWAVVALVWLVPVPPAALAAPRTAEVASAYSLEAGCRMLAERVLEVVRQEGREKSVIVGSFQAAPRLASSGGVGLAHRVRQALEAEGIAVGSTGSVQLLGRFRDEVARPDFGDEGVVAEEGVALRVEYTLLDDGDKELAKGVINVFGDGPLEIAGGTADLRTGDGGADASNRRRQAAISASFRRPQAFVAGDETRPRGDSPFGVEVQVKRSGRNEPRRPAVRDGRAFVALSKGDEYEVRLHNRTKDTVLVSLTIDGLDAFTFSEDPGDRGRKVHFVVEPESALSVPGWFINAKRSDTFRITGYARSEAVKMLGSSEEVGQITAAFYRAEPPVMIVSARVDEATGERIGTERGDAVETNYRRASFREGAPLATITVRYEKAP